MNRACILPCLRLPEVGLLNTNDFLMVEMYVIRMQDVIGKQ